ncbi:MAG: hydrogenase iron-sulfur subunit [Tenuifilaceae bacterium]|jgi:coenzyme F420-reducing hydrogenase delta subunit|nr:hydrogenase iron-sulfur subunit [Bacteroidales bacterium]MDI9517455.1 hydrogenase iron-sulfur subunit [Bacteroidota bacterium]NLH55437.1 hydrogenase iron-sulfur subunit [Rikenellaceae bacterium]OQC63323.1 MAG: Methyl-viologen-reducing hydrogenase, delta subunit [Bacteroidetes bacterium ADurb.Bin008]HNV82521.1 hydrogenase iron-sulfur subunit [Tenuifilaceae bacterium]
MSAENAAPKILVFSTDIISDPGIDQAGLLKLHYSPSVYTISLPCSSGIKPRWIMRAFEKGFDGVFIAADGHECSYSPKCSEYTNKIIEQTQEMMREKNINPKRIRMAALCSVCAESFVSHMGNFSKILAELGSIQSEISVSQ